MTEDKLSNEEQKLFNQLPKEKVPPQALEKKVINKLHNDGLLKGKHDRTIYLKWVASIAASILLFTCGILFERLGKSSESEIDSRKGYILLLHEDNHFTPGEPMEMFNEYKKWMISTTQKGIKIKGQELKDESVNVDKSGISDLSIHEERTTGYFILEAETLEQAIHIAQDNPHIKYGGAIEVKPYMIR